jgi:hypothetical protein
MQLDAFTGVTPLRRQSHNFLDSALCYRYSWHTLQSVAIALTHAASTNFCQNGNWWRVPRAGGKEEIKKRRVVGFTIELLNFSIRQCRHD